MTAFVVPAAGGEPIPAAGVEHLFKLTGDRTGGRFAFEVFTLPPLTVGAAPHVHGSHDEYFYVVEGSLTVATDAGETALVAGDLAAAPRGSVHGFRNASGSPVRALCMYTPAGYENYFRDVHRTAVTDPAALAALRADYDTETL